MVAAAVILALALVAWRAERLARAVLEARQVARSRELAIAERRLTLEEMRQAAVLEPEEVPVDLRLRYEMETESWAKEQMRSLIRELYAEHKNWDAVRHQISHLDVAAGMQEPGWSQTQVLS